MTLLLHLTDLHLESTMMLDSTKIVSNLPDDKKLDNCFIIFSGDFSQRADQKEISCFDKAIRDIKKLLDDKYGVDSIIVVVPGNHDIYLNESISEKNRLVVENSKKEIKAWYLENIKNERASLDYCKKYGIDFNDGGIEYLTYDFNDIRFHFVLVNSAPFSMLGSEDKDKGIHYLLPSDYPLCGNPKNGFKTIEILVSHHRPDWFLYDSKVALENFEENIASFCFYGHEHNCKHKEITVDYEGSTIISRGGELKLNKNQLVGSFAAYYLDNECKCCDIFKYAFDYRKNKFKTYKFENKNLRTNTPLRIKNSFIDSSINPSLKENIAEKDVFVMPLLSASGNQESIVSFDSFIDFVELNKGAFLFGPSKSGKSILIHRVFEYYQAKKWCILFDIKKNYVNDLTTAIKNIFDDEYVSAANIYDDFVSAPIDEKIVLVDNFDLIDKEYKKDEFLSYLTNNFGTIIIASEKKNKSVTKNVKDYFKEEKTFNISGFSLKQRIEFYKKYLNKHNVSNDNELAIVINSIEASVSSCSVLDMSDPSYLLPLVSQIYDNKLYQERCTQNAFSIIFEHSIRDAILNVVGPEQLDDCISIIQLIAYYTVFKKDCASFDFSDISLCAKERRKNFNHIKLTDEDVLNALLESKLVHKEDNDYVFERNSFLAYFAAQEVIRLYQKGDAESFNEVIKNIVHGINGDIFIFSIYQLKSINVFYDIHDTLDSLLKEFEEISFETKNNPLLKLNKKLIPETREQAENRKELYDRLDRADRNRIATAKEKERSAFNDDGSKEIRAVTKIAKLIEISCKVISGFPTDIDSETRLLFLEKTMSAVLKVTNLLFSFGSEEEIKRIENDFNEAKQKWIENSKRQNLSSDYIKKIEELDIVHAFYDCLMTFILNFETSMAKIVSSRASMPIINKICDNEFFKRLFKIIVYSENGNFDAFCNQIKDIYDNPAQNKEQILIVSRVVRIFALTNNLNSSQCSVLSKITKIPQIKLLEYISNSK